MFLLCIRTRIDRFFSFWCCCCFSHALGYAITTFCQTTKTDKSPPHFLYSGWMGTTTTTTTTRRTKKKGTVLVGSFLILFRCTLEMARMMDVAVAAVVCVEQVRRSSSSSSGGGGAAPLDARGQKRSIISLLYSRPPPLPPSLSHPTNFFLYLRAPVCAHCEYTALQEEGEEEDGKTYK